MFNEYNYLIFLLWVNSLKIEEIPLTNNLKFEENSEKYKQYIWRILWCLKKTKWRKLCDKNLYTDL